MMYKEEFDKLLTTEAAPWVILNSLKKAKDAAIWIFKDPKSGSFVLCMGALGYLATQRDFSQRSKDDFFKRDTVSDLAFSADAIQLSLQDFDGLRNGFLYAQGVISSKINPSNFQASIVSNGKDSLLKLLSDINGIFLGDLLEAHHNAQRCLRKDDYITNIPGLYILSNLWYYAESYGKSPVHGTGLARPLPEAHTELKSMDQFTVGYINRTISDNTTISEMAEGALAVGNVICLEVFILKQYEANHEKFKTDDGQKLLNMAVDACNTFIYDTPSLYSITNSSAKLQSLVKDLKKTAAFNDRVMQINPYLKGVGLHAQNIEVDAFFKQKGIAFTIQLVELLNTNYPTISAAVGLYGDNPIRNSIDFLKAFIEQNPNFVLLPFGANVIGSILLRYHRIRDKKWNAKYKAIYAVTGAYVQGATALALFLSHGLHISYLNSLISHLPGLIGGLSAMIQCRIAMVLYSYVSSLVLGHPGICRPIITSDTDSFTLVIFLKCITERYPITKNSLPYSVQETLSNISEPTKTTIVLKPFDGISMEDKINLILPYQRTLFEKIKLFFEVAKETVTGTKDEKPIELLFCSVLDNQTKNPSFVCTHNNVNTASGGSYILFKSTASDKPKTTIKAANNITYTLIGKAFNNPNEVQFQIEEQWLSCSPGKAAQFTTKKEMIELMFPTYCLYERVIIDDEIDTEKTFEIQLQSLKAALRGLHTKKIFLEIGPSSQHDMKLPLCELKAAYLSAYPKKKELLGKEYAKFLFDIIQEIPPAQKKKFESHPNFGDLFPTNQLSMTKLTRSRWNFSEGREALLYGLANYFCKKNPKTKRADNTASFTVIVIDQVGTQTTFTSTCRKERTILEPPSNPDIASHTSCDNCLYIGVIMPHLFMRDPHYIQLVTP